MKKQYDVAAFVWPSYSGDDPRTRLFWPEGMGEWETVRSAASKFPGHIWPRKPAWGYVNEADRYVMEMQINAAADHGVNVFIYDWYWFDNRPFLENCLNDGFLKARNNSRMKFYLMWANHNVNYIWDKRNSDLTFQDVESSVDDLVFTGAVCREQFEQVAHRVIEKYFGQPNYYRIDGKPVFMIYCLSILVGGLGGIEKTREALDWFREECKKAGFPGVHLQLDTEKWGYELYDGDRLMTMKEVVDCFGFDSATTYQMKNLTSWVGKEYAQVSEEAQAAWQRIGAQCGVPYFPQVSVGWDNNPRFHGLKDVMPGSSPEQFERTLAAAKRYVEDHAEQPPLITINSWNEWTEGSYLEPDNVNGYRWLEAIKNVFGGTEE